MEPEEGELRLVAQREVNGYTFGALQIFRDGAFGAVCGANIFNVEADVACRQLGFAGGDRVLFPFDVFSPAEITEVAVPAVLEVASCAGSEGRLLDCTIATEDDYYVYFDYRLAPLSCAPSDFAPGSNNAFVACGRGAASGSGPEDGELRLVDTVTSDDGLSQYGRLEVARFGGWGLACDGGIFTGRFSLADARVACGILGFADGFPVKLGVVRDNADLLLPIWLGNVGCEGTESSFEDCPGFDRAAGNTNFCTGSGAIDLICSAGPSPELDGRLRLTGGDTGPGYEFGRLEIFLRGFWSAACDGNGFTADAAQVACRALGFDGGARVREVSRLAQSSLPPGISRVDCDGTEASLLDCVSSQSVGIQTGCGVPGSNATDATVLACGLASTDCDIEPVEEQDALRLIGGFGSPCDPVHTGIVEIFNEGAWGAICNGGDRRPADDPAATVICRQLGFAFGTVIDGLIADPQAFPNYYSPGSYYSEAEEPQERYWLRSDVRCDGDEQRLADCRLGGGFVSVPLSDDGFFDACAINNSVAIPNLRLQVECRQFAVA